MALLNTPQVLSQGGSLSSLKDFVSAVVTHRRARLLFLFDNIMLKCEIHKWCITPICIFSASGHEILARVGGTRFRIAVVSLRCKEGTFQQGVIYQTH